MKTFIKILLFFVLIVLILDISMSFFLYDLAIARSKNDALVKSTALEESVPVNAQVMLNADSGMSSDSDMQLKLGKDSSQQSMGSEISRGATSLTDSTEPEIDWFNKDIYEQVFITSDDNIPLTGYFYPAKSPTDKTVILAHGYSSQGTYMAPYAKLYSEKFGYNVLMPDDRGHGSSGGDAIGFGWLDRKDYLKWIDYVIKRIGQNSRIVIHGVSMGGAAVLMTSGEALPSNVKALVSDCAYTSVWDELAYQLKLRYNLPPFPILNTTSILTKIRAGYSFEEASALKQVAKSKTPVLFIHGADDTFVPSYMVKELYDACSSEKDLLVVPGAGHGAAFNTAPEVYTNKVGQFITKYVN